MIIEMRTYKTKPGKRAEFLDIFRSKSVPAHDEIGMKILGPFLSLEDPDTFFFMRGFPDLSSREPMKAKFYEGELWKREMESNPSRTPTPSSLYVASRISKKWTQDFHSDFGACRLESAVSELNV